MAERLEYIKTFDKKIIGIIKYKSNGDKVAMTFPGRKILGFYLKDRDSTTDLSYRVLTKGDTLIGLIYQHAGIQGK